MPDAVETLRDLLTGFNSLAMHAGLTPISLQNQGFSMPTTPMPQIKSPGQVSQELMQQATEQLESTTRATRRLHLAPGPGVLGYRPSSLDAGVGQPPTPVSGATGAYSSQYRERMQAIEEAYLPPYLAQRYAGGTGQAPFFNLPSPIFQTAPAMGIFRPSITQPPPLVRARQTPLIPTPFTPPLPTPWFQSREDLTYQQQEFADERAFAATAAAIPTAVNVGGAAIATGAGVLGGRAIGGLLGSLVGARGRAIGRVGGAVVGGLGGLFSGIGEGAEEFVETDIVDPIVRKRAMGRQLEHLSRKFVLSGADLNPDTGRGLSTQASMRLAGGLQQDVEQGRASGFNMRALMHVTDLAAQGGMLDMAQSGEQIRQQVRNIARGLQSFMMIAKEPDVQRAMQQMSSMRAMGLTLPETSVAMQNAQTFARMAGTTIQGLQEQAGLPGALTFQRMGMTAGLGMQVGHAASAFSRQAIAGGAFSPGQLAMAGGHAGLTQTLTEAGAAGLGVNFPLLAMLERRGPDGQLAINQERAQQIMRGEISLSQQAQMGAQNVQDLGGSRVILELSTRLNELRDELGRTLGPQGTTMLAFRQAANVMQAIPGMTLGGALQQIGMNPQQARSLERIGTSSQFWQNVRDQREFDIQQIRGAERQRRRAQMAQADFTSQITDAIGMSRVFERPMEVIQDIGQGISEWWTDRGRSERAREQGGVYLERRPDLEFENIRQQQAGLKALDSEDYKRYARRTRAELMRGTERSKGLTFGEQAGTVWNVALGGAAAAAGLVAAPVAATLGLGTFAASAVGLGAGIGTDLLTDFISSSAPEESDYIAALRARGGIRGTLADWFPSLMTAETMVSGRGGSDIYRAMEEGRGAAEVGQSINVAKRLTKEQAFATTRDLRGAYREFARAEGVTVEPEQDRMRTMLEATIQAFNQAGSGFGSTGLTTNELQDKIIARLVKNGEREEVATRFVREKWTSGLSASLLYRAKPLLSKKGQAAWAQSEEAFSLTDRLGGSTLKQIEANAEKRIKTAKELSGYYNWLNASEEAWSAFKDQAVTGTRDELLMLAAIGQKAFTGDATDEGKRLEAMLRQKYGPEEVERLAHEASIKYRALEAEDKEEVFEEFGKKAGAKGQTYESLTGDEGMLTNIQRILKYTPVQEAVQRGAVAFRGAGVTAFSKWFGKEGSIEKVVKDLFADDDQLKIMRDKSPEMLNLLEQFRDAHQSGDSERLESLRNQINKRLFRAGGGGMRSGGVYGTTGAGSSAEIRAGKQSSAEASVETAIKEGKPAEAFAKAVPSFARASGELSVAAARLQQTINNVLFSQRTAP